MKTPAFVAISDVHFSLSNLELSTQAFLAAVDKAEELGVPLVDCGDLTNDKAIIRGEVMNQLLTLYKSAKLNRIEIYSIVGNHSLLNERSTEHGLNFLKPYANVINDPLYIEQCSFIPYQTDPEEFKRIYNEQIERNPRFIFMHQGVLEGDKGDYIQDKSAIPREFFDNGPKVFSGHYHRHHTIGKVTYVGNPFTMSFGEANDGPKGYLIIYEDGSFEQVPLNLRKHVIVEYNTSLSLNVMPDPSLNDLVWVKCKGTPEELAKISKEKLQALAGVINYKLDLIPTETSKAEVRSNLTSEQILDELIDNELATPQHKTYLKNLWREVLE